MAATTTLEAVLKSGLLSARPAATAVAAGSLYVATDDGNIYQSDGSSWSTWATLGTSGASVPDPSGEPDGEVLLTSGGAAVWGADPGGGGADVSLETVASSGASQTVDYSTARNWDITLTADCTLALSGFTNGEADFLFLKLVQDATGSRTITWPTIVWIGSGIPPILQTAAGSVDSVVLFSFDGGTTVYGIAQTSASGLTSGTSFPVSPSDGDLFYRTDRRILYEYDSTSAHWLSVDRKYVALQNSYNGVPATGGQGRMPIFEDIYVESWVTVTNANPNDGSNNWTMKIFKTDHAANNTDLTSFTTASDGINYTTHNVPVAAVFAAASYTAISLYVSVKTGAPGSLVYGSMLILRSVG